MTHRILISLFLLFACRAQAAIVVDFESLPTPGAGFYNGDTSAAGGLRSNFQVIGSRDNFGSTEFVQRWSSQGVQFENNFTPDFNSWSGWSWSKVIDSTTAGFTNQYASFPGGGADTNGNVQAGGTYAVAFGNTFFNLPTGVTLKSLDIANTTYAALSMRDGDAFAKRFGGQSGNDPDFFRVTLSGFDQADGKGNQVGSQVVSLADFTSANSQLDFIRDRWLRVDLSGLSNARSLSFRFESSDVSGGFINTPVYVAIDNLTFNAVPEPSSLLLTFSSLMVLTLHRRNRKS